MSWTNPGKSDEVSMSISRRYIVVVSAGLFATSVEKKIKK